MSAAVPALTPSLEPSVAEAHAALRLGAERGSNPLRRGHENNIFDCLSQITYLRLSSGFARSGLGEEPYVSVWFSLLALFRASKQFNGRGMRIFGLFDVSETNSKTKPLAIPEEK